MRLPSSFGCNYDDQCSDNARHYLICPVLHAALTELLAELQLFQVILLGITDDLIEVGVADSDEHPFPDAFFLLLLQFCTYYQ